MPYGMRLLMALVGGAMFVTGALLGVDMIARKELYDGGFSGAAVVSGIGFGMLSAARVRRDE
ncbi:MAG TPA: hypothetical protein VNA20_12240 [Frankiaceae bacterium]|nr:hypothetical protein [Frankiaceae bacterium]